MLSDLRYDPVIVVADQLHGLPTGTLQHPRLEIGAEPKLDDSRCAKTRFEQGRNAGPT